MEKLLLESFPHFKEFEVMYHFFSTNVFDCLSYIRGSSFDAAIHATIYLLFAKWFQRNKEKEEYIHRFENTFVYTNSYHTKKDQFEEEGEMKLKIEILWLERNKHKFNKDIQNDLQKIFDFAKQWNRNQRDETRSLIYIHQFLLENKNDIENVILKMKGK